MTSTAAAAAGQEEDGPWDEARGIVAAHVAATTPVAAKFSGGVSETVYLALRVDTASPALVAAVMGQFDRDRCRLCRDFLGRGAGTYVNWCPEVGVTTCLDGVGGGTAYAEVAAAYRSAACGWVVATAEAFTCDPTAGGFEHLAYAPPRRVTPVAVGPEGLTPADLAWIVGQQLPVLRPILFPAAAEERGGMIASLEILEGLIDGDEVPYGDKLRDSTVWMLEHLRRADRVPPGDPVARDLACITCLFASPVVRGGPDERVVSLWLRQYTRNTVSALEHAYDKPALVGLLTKRFDPTTYQRATTAPSARELQAAAQAFDREFNPCLMHVDDVVDLGGWAPGAPGAAGAAPMGSFLDRALAAAAPPATKTQRAAGFAGRAGGGTAPPPRSRAVGPLLAALGRWAGSRRWRLQVFVGPLDAAVALTKIPEPARHMWVYEHLWCFYKGKTIASLLPDRRSGKYVDVSVLYAWRKNVFVGIRGAAPSVGVMANTCFSELLAPAYHHLRKVVEAFNKAEEMDVPAPRPCGWGLGVGASNHKGNKMSSGLQFRWVDASGRVDEGGSFTVDAWE